MADINTMRLDPVNLTGLAHKKFMQTQYARCLGNPKLYFKIREKLIDELTTALVTDVYTIFFNALGEGKTKSGADIEVAADGAAGTPAAKLGTPNYPKNLVNNLSLDCIAMLEEHVNKIVDIIAPQNLDTIASTKIGISGKADSINVPHPIA